MQEREFDSNIADRLAEVIPAGSSAATADGGSGFNSPDLLKHGVPTLAPGPMRPPNLRRSSGLKRNRRSDDSVPSRTRAAKSPKVEEND